MVTANIQIQIFLFVITFIILELFYTKVLVQISLKATNDTSTSY